MKALHCRLLLWQTLLIWGCLAAEHNNIFNHTARDPGPFPIGKDVAITISTDLEISEIQPKTIIKGKRVSHTYTVYNEEASYIALHFESLDIEGECRLLITDRFGKQPYTLKGKDKNGLTSFWARLITGDTAVLSVTCHGENGVGSFLIDKYAAGFKTLSSNTNPQKEDDGSRPSLRGIENLLEWNSTRRELTVCGTDDLRNSQCYRDSHPTEYKISRAVGKIVINGRGACTGWLTTNQNYFVTNRHCVRGTSDALNSYVIFNYEVQDGGGNCAISTRDSVSSEIQQVYEVDRLVAAVYIHDYAIIQLTDRPSAPLKQYGFLQTEPRTPNVGEEIYIPQHPAGDDKAMAIWDSQYGVDQRCRTLVPVVACYGSSAYLDVRYTCDTEGGSSGSPVISAETHKVVALHHCGEASTCSGNEGVPMSYLHGQFVSTLGDWSQTPLPQTQQCLDNEYEVLLELQTDLFGYETTWELRDSSGSLIGEGGKILYLRMNEFYTYKYCVPKGDVYTLLIEDSGQDGMCCQHGNGSYTVHVDGEMIATGGSFLSSVSVTIDPQPDTTQSSVGPSDGPSVSIRPSISPSTVPSKDPSIAPSTNPSLLPSTGPSRQPSIMPSTVPSLSKSPSIEPSLVPSQKASGGPSFSIMPSIAPSTVRSREPSILPSMGPSILASKSPSRQPSIMPSTVPSLSKGPSVEPSLVPSQKASDRPSLSIKPSIAPSTEPSILPSKSPSAQPSIIPSALPSVSQGPSIEGSVTPSQSIEPSLRPSQGPSFEPSLKPSQGPSIEPSLKPSEGPSIEPSQIPSTEPSESKEPSHDPSIMPSISPSIEPSNTPSVKASGVPSGIPSVEPSSQPSALPSNWPSANPSLRPSNNPSAMASEKPSVTPSAAPSSIPSTVPSNKPSKTPSIQPSGSPSAMASEHPSARPSLRPSQIPTVSPMPSQIPSLVPSKSPSSKPSQNPSSGPTHDPTSGPTSNPTSGPTSRPTSGPTSRPTWGPTSGPTLAPTTRTPTFSFLTPSNSVGFDGPRYEYFTPLTSRIGIDGPRAG